MVPWQIIKDQIVYLQIVFKFFVLLNPPYVSRQGQLNVVMAEGKNQPSHTHPEV